MDQSTKNVLSARQVSFAVSAPGGRLEILKDISLDLNAGETLAIVGTSGSGKTTLLGLLAGLDQPSTGTIRLIGHDLGPLDENARAHLRKRHVGFVFQSFHLLPSLTALENVMLALEIAGFDDARQRAENTLDQVGLNHRLKHYPRQLSGGEQQRVAIARAFAGQPDILFADEPTGNLDQRTGRAVADLLFELNAHHGTALVLVTHDLQLARRCSQIKEIEGGHIAALDGQAVAGHHDRPGASPASGR